MPPVAPRTSAVCLRTASSEFVFVMQSFWPAGGSKEIPQHGVDDIQKCMASTIGWELYRSLLGVLREGSLSAAARELGITQPTVGRHIAALEQLLGAPL